MSRFAEEGFLSTAMGGFSQQCRRKFSEWFALCSLVNRYGIGIIPRMGYHPDNRQEYLCAALFLRVLSTFEATVILTKRCMLDEARMILRALMEALFALRAIALDAEMAEAFYQNNLNLKLKALHKYKDSHSDDEIPHGVDVDKRVAELKEQVNVRGVSSVSVEKLARKAKLYDYYTSAYTVLSWTVHSNILDIASSYMAGRSDDYIEMVQLSPQMEEADKLLMSALECVVRALQSVNELFRLNAEEEIKDYTVQYQTLYRSTRKVGNH